ncbi:hypothetical protein EXN66_Car011698 [Channa argus]|uniref:Uncharacterized protein n=1 Tax=Channa argus TaxID=215402 RepID=A0A6G1Q0J5_CHAAH|nr:hypothetical protein EXN66_Car011698 [Channa argus]KAK2902356.1 hypothetical protein Q8A73_012102 [Channa argus]
MSELSSETNPEILVNGEQQEHQQNDAATTEASPDAPVCLDGECPEDSTAAEKETQVKMQYLFQQVRNKIRSQGAPKSSILELVQRVIDREVEIAQVNSEPEDKDVSSEEEKEVELLTGESKVEMSFNKEEFCAIFEEKLETSKKALRDEFEQQISQVRKEMQAYTDRALKELQCKIQSGQSRSLLQTHLKEAQESKGPDKKQKPAAVSSLTSRRGRLLTRTMTTIIPKTCAPVIIGPRAKSETLTSSKGESSRFLPRDPALYLRTNKSYQSRKPLPPACPPLCQCKKSAQAKAKTEN